MRQIIIEKNDAGQRLDKFMSKRFKTMPSSLLYKYIRRKCVRINGEKVFSCQSESRQVQVPMEQGIYVVHVNNQNHSFCKKIVIQ